MWPLSTGARTRNGWGSWKALFRFCACMGTMNQAGEIVARASRPCDSCDQHTGETPVPLPDGSWKAPTNLKPCIGPMNRSDSDRHSNRGQFWHPSRVRFGFDGVPGVSLTLNPRLMSGSPSGCPAATGHRFCPPAQQEVGSSSTPFPPLPPVRTAQRFSPPTGAVRAQRLRRVNDSNLEKQTRLAVRVSSRKVADDVRRRTWQRNGGNGITFCQWTDPRVAKFPCLHSPAEPPGSCCSAKNHFCLVTSAATGLAKILVL
jgi:hypothetical protein